MAKDKKTPANTASARTRRQHAFDDNIRFVVPMPGRSAYHSQYKQPALKKIHTFSEMAGDFPLEDYQAQFLMEREYLVD